MSINTGHGMQRVDLYSNIFKWSQAADTVFIF